MRYKKHITALLILIMVFVRVASCFAMIGDEDAETHNISGDVEAEKAQEGQLFVPFGLAATTSAPALTTVSGPFGILVGGIGTATMGMGKIADPKYATWENWPMSRWSFDHAEPEGGFGFSAMADKAQAGTVDMFADGIFFISKSLTRLSINMLVWAFNLNIIQGMSDWISEGIRTIFDFDSDLTFLLMSWGIIALLVYSIFYFMKGQLSSILSAIFIAVFAVGGAFFFTAHCNSIIEDVNNGFNKVTGVALSAVGSYTSEGQNINAPDPLNKGIILCGESAWNVIVTLPWSVTLFGSVNENDLKLTNEEANNISDNINDYIPSSKTQLIYPGARADTIYLATIGEARKQVVEVLAASKDINHGKHSGTVVGLSSYSTINHIITAGLTIFPAVAFFLLVIMVALPVIFAQGMLGAMLLLLPAALFALIVPVQGWSLATRYFKKTLHFLLIKLLLGFYLSIVITIGTAFALACLQISVGLAAFILTVIFGGALFLRKKFYDAVLNTARQGYYKNKKSLSKMRNVTRTMRMIRNISIADAVMDFKDLRRSGKKPGTLKPESPKPSTSNIGNNTGLNNSRNKNTAQNNQSTGANTTGQSNHSNKERDTSFDNSKSDGAQSYLDNSHAPNKSTSDEQSFDNNNDNNQGIDLNTGNAVPKRTGNQSKNKYSQQNKSANNAGSNKQNASKYDSTIPNNKNNNSKQRSEYKRIDKGLDNSSANPKNTPKQDTAKRPKRNVNNNHNNENVSNKQANKHNYKPSNNSKSNSSNQHSENTRMNRSVDNSSATPKNTHKTHRQETFERTKYNNNRRDDDTDSNPLNQVNINSKDN